MALFEKNGVEILLPPMDKSTRLHMERCAEFMARMIQKYGKEVMAEIEARDKNHTDCSEG